MIGRVQIKLTIWFIAVALAISSLGEDHASKEFKSLQGTWQLTSIYQTSNIQAIDSAQQQKLLHSRISYNAHSLRACGESVGIVSVESRRLSPKEFFAGYYVNFDEVGINGRSITELLINKDQSGNCFGTYTLPGQRVYIKGPNDLLINFGGVFYRALREN
jgi:hypothetical protein